MASKGDPLIVNLLYMYATYRFNGQFVSQPFVNLKSHYNLGHCPTYGLQIREILLQENPQYFPNIHQNPRVPKVYRDMGELHPD